MNNPRLQKYLANLGLGSRREIERWIKAGRITINDRIAKLGDCVAPTDKIYLDDDRITQKPSHAPSEILAYHKRAGEVCTRSDPEGRKTVFSNLPPIKKGRWIMIGRLDITTSGLLLFTNDGELANQFMHPSSEMEREYKVRVLGDVTPEILSKLRRGVRLEDGLAKPKQIKYLNGKGANAWYQVILTEGRNREVRRLFESQGLKVSRLVRVRFGGIRLSKLLKPGDVMRITDERLLRPKSPKTSRRNLSRKVLRKR